MKRTIQTDEAPAAVGAYSQAATDGNLLFTAGQIPLTTDGDLRVDRPIAEQTELALDNVKSILASEGLGMDDVLKVNVYLADIDDFEEMNETYATYFEEDPPARSAVGVGSLPKGAGVEVEVVASTT